MKKRFKINKDNLTVLIFLLLLVTTFCLNIKIKVNDELWNFSNIYKMSNGYQIYTDLNVIITPLFFYVGELLFRVFGANYFIYRMYNVAIFTMFFYTIYQIFVVLKIDRKNCKVYTTFIFLLFIAAITQSANYNILVVNFVLLGIYLFIRYKDRRLSNNIWQGIVLFLIFMTKQSVGALYVIGLIGAKLINIIEDKNTFKFNFLDLVSIAAIFSSLVGICAMCLNFTNNLYDAINYTILGMSEFTNNTASDSIIWVVLILVIYIVPMYISNSKKINLSSDKKYNIKLLLCFSISMLPIMYPIFNKYHMAVAVLVGIITLLYTFDVLFLSELFEEYKIKKVFKVISAIIVVALFVTSISVYLLNPQKYSYNHPYYGSNIAQKDIDSINIVCKYIQDTDAEVISSQANLYMNILNKNNGIFDLPFRGNFGKDGEQALINKIEDKEPKIVLIDNEEQNKIFYQNSEQLREYVLNNYEYKGEIEKLLIYELK